eukprot:365522-Chlamydomonas_euryale.AAC.7
MARGSSRVQGQDCRDAGPKRVRSNTTWAVQRIVDCMGPFRQSRARPVDLGGLHEPTRPWKSLDCRH